ncbi:MAG TPA: hypothetical protein PKE64_31215 [Anaerolineae bacterium]|nr:hypothetical protein [Anaerolineae bacterium]
MIQHNGNGPTQFIVYACPFGELAEQIDAYYERSRAECGPNPAHNYMPHCSLTGFFHDQAAALPLYLNAIESAFWTSQTHRPQTAIHITRTVFEPDFHGLELEAPWVKALVADFASRVDSPSLAAPLRLKQWLHLSFAYQFLPAQHERLAHLARTIIDPQAPSGWELRFYERHCNGNWICHQAWPLDF